MDVWDDTIHYLCEAVRYIEAIGFDPSNLTSDNLMLPIAYYFYLKEMPIDARKCAMNQTDKIAHADRHLYPNGCCEQ